MNVNRLSDHFQTILNNLLNPGSAYLFFYFYYFRSSNPEAFCSS